MNLGVFLAIGESFKDFKNKGQDKLIEDYLLKNYSRNFEKVFVFSYADESFNLFGNVYVVPNRFRLHRYFYSWLLPVIHGQYIKQCSVLRGLQLTGAIPAAISKLLFGKKIVFNYGYDYYEFAKIEKKPLQALGFKLLEYPLLSAADKIIVTTRYLRQKLATWVADAKLVRLPNGVDTDLFRPLKLRKQATLIFVGRLERQKNLPVLLQAIAKLRKGIKLLIIGNGSQSARLNALANRYRVDMTVMGHVAHKLLPQYLNQAEIFVLPSLIEGQPKALLEAMSCGLAVIASDITSHREIISHLTDGILAATDVASLVKSLDLLIGDRRLRKKIGVAARMKILAHFNQKQLNQKEIELLKGVVT